MYSLTKIHLGKLPQSLKLIALFSFFILLITSCSSQAPKVENKKTTKNIPTAQAETTLTGNERLTIAKEFFTQGRVEEAVNELIKASELFLEQGSASNSDYKKALWLADKVLLMTLSEQYNSENNKYLGSYQLMLVRASSLFALGYIEPSHQQLKAIEIFVHKHNLPLTLRYYQNLNNIWQEQNRPVELLHSNLHAFALQQDITTEQLTTDITSIWTQLSKFSPWQIDLLSTKQAPYRNGWLQLIQVANEYGKQTAPFDDDLLKWRKSYPVHPANLIVEQLLLNKTQKTSFNNIAVLLPLSGSQKAAGLAAQQGILAAYKSDGDTKLHFIDTTTLVWGDLNQSLIGLSADFVIGPLLKDNLEKYLSLQNSVDINNEVKLSSVTTLLLNVPKSLPLKEGQFALSMRPEDEGIQAAASLSNASYKHPIILSHDDAVSRRIANAFVTQWKKMTKTLIDVVYFESGKKMQADIKTSLDVIESESRIKELTNNLKYSLKTQTRNRRDVDMIYLIGSAKQTRLVKPFIEVNISPFAKTIPVFASSRSHSIKSDNSSSSDLQGLTFTEIPWLLNSTMQNKTLASTSKELWPKRSDSLSRIFALGYDSLNLLSTLSQMKKSPYIRHYGQTGVLQLNSDGVLNRSLLWGQYKRGKVVEVEID
jgi:outer membrane PBP1 activator LpoA protein